MNHKTISNDVRATISERSLSSELKSLISAGSEKIIKDMDYLLKGYNLSEVQ